MIKIITVISHKMTIREGKRRKMEERRSVANISLGHHSLIPCFLSHKEVLVHAGGRLLLLFIIPIK